MGCGLLWGYNLSHEVILFYYCREVVFGFSLHWCCERGELGVAGRVVNTLFKQLQFRLAYSKLTIHLEEALSSIVERVQANRLKLKIL